MAVLSVIIYVAFISLGLPDSLLGSSWPSMYGGFGVHVSYAGFISMIIAGGTIVSSLFSDTLIRKIGTGSVTLVSVAMTAFALLGISFSNSFMMVCLFAVPLGLGAGSVDAALNNFVAVHYKASHMNWIHGFWGIGASLGPILLAYLLGKTGMWESGYRGVSIIQFALVAVLIASLPLWKRVPGSVSAEGNAEERKSAGIPGLLRLPKAKSTMISFFCYCGLETTTGLWGSTYLVVVRNVPADRAAGWISLFYIGITLGRFLSGFLSMKLTQKNMIRLGQLCIALGILCIVIPLPEAALTAGFFLIGLGCAPIYPSLLHETPNTFGTEQSQGVMGIQMACAYIGTTFMPPLFGVLGARTGYGLFPFYLGALLIVMILAVHLIYRKNRKAPNAEPQTAAGI
ncbi:MFS transporter [Breznakiella homolactica]|uniref:MFS transporter n=1 Tax=Breznakiella homolactica TaxID=2798577 RepID=A0A7T7XP88_9SPIR|nr:MFS transporter [Breznakiella homolactica]QQO09984.1 MFS transporter [Breznakiella homolactica]